ncbi:MAG: hypothetical protein CMM75_03660 [Rhodospirillaceae bacterium]|nr:hypothetical protein [Rhodospirillaceae bacterium]
MKPELIGEDRSPTSGSTPRVRWGTKILTGMITLAGLGGLVMALSYGYDKTNLSRDSSVIPIISARDGPTKLKPEKPGGMAIHHQDKNVYNRIDPTARQSKVEKLLPPPDPVMSKPGSKNLKKNKKTNKLNSSKPVLGKDPPPIRSLARGGSRKKNLVEKNIKIGKEKLVSETSVPLKSGYRVQFASLRKKRDAAASWKKLKNKYPALLVNLKPSIERTVIAGKGTYYRLQAGIFKNSESARALCKKAKTKNIGCFIVKLR